MARHWSVIQIGIRHEEKALLRYEKWEIQKKEFRENLAWAVVVPGNGETSEGVGQLLAEISARGVTIHHTDTGCG